MEKESISLSETSNLTEKLLRNPPKLILVFDYAGVEEGDKVMKLRSALAASIYHSTLYKENNLPTICCFAGPHSKGDQSGSSQVKNHLMELGIDEKHILTRETTITTNTDIMQLHALMVVRNESPALIVTTDDHVKRTEQEVQNRFKKLENVGKKPNIMVISPSTIQLEKLNYREEKKETGEKLRKLIHSLNQEIPGGGPTEKVAYLLSRHWLLKKYLQPFAEKITHPYTPPNLQRIQRVAKKMLGKN